MFGRKRRSIEVFRPVAGRLVRLEDVPDPVFSGKVMGDGFAVDPQSGLFHPPLDGELIVVANTGHAFGVRSAEGLEVLVHIGIDTVKLKGEGFRTLRAVGEQVSRSDPIVEVDLAAVGPQVPSLLSPVIVTNGAAFEFEAADTEADESSPVLMVKPKK